MSIGGRDVHSRIGWTSPWPNEEDPDSIIDDIRTAIERLVWFPELGHVRDDLADRQLRVWTVHTYLVIYLPDTSPLQVIRILHGYRNLSAILD